MDKGKAIAASSPQGTGASSPDSSDDEWGKVAGSPLRVVGERGSTSTAGGRGGASSSSSTPSATQAIGPLADGRGVPFDYSLVRLVVGEPRERASPSTAGGVGGVSSSSSSAPAETTREAVAPFEDGQYVRLRNRGRGGYLFADEDGRGVRVDRRRRTANTAWAVQILRGRVLLRSAYGRYLSATLLLAAGAGLVGRYTRQCAFEEPDHPEIEWSATMGERRSVVLLQGSDLGLGALRANGRYQRWNTEVTFGPVDYLYQVSSMMEWEVQVIPQTLARPPYQPNAAIRLPKGSEEMIDITYSLAWLTDIGSIEHDEWITIGFRGRSLIRLRDEIANLVGIQSENITLFTQAGFLAQPIPLLTDLHLRHDPRMILVFTVDSPGYDRLRFPDLSAE